MKWIWKSDSRYYIVRLQESLFGEWTLVKNWGGLNNKLGGAQMHTFDTLEKAITELGNIGETRMKRNYATSKLRRL